MEIIKSTIKEDIIKVEIGDEIDENSKGLTGTVELDIENQSQFVNIINSIFDDGTVKVMVDMVNVSYIDSSGLWALFEGHKKAAQKNGKLVLLRPTKDVKRVLDITKMSSKMKIFEAEAEALACLNE
ncbi:STAS domain-containing protein [bacterium]|jgi:anti-anti-sigma factor|nr:STAS domain-containing protein [bacterium]